MLIGSSCLPIAAPKALEAPKAGAAPNPDQWNQIVAFVSSRDEYPGLAKNRILGSVPQTKGYF